MAVIQNIMENITTWGERERVHICSWNSMGGSDEGAPLAMPASNDRSVQVVGSFDGATVALQGSNDGVNFSVLTDPQGISLNFNSPKIEVITELTRFIKPVVSGGGPLCSVNVIVLVRKGD